jgi:hypothetical protein
MSATVSTDAPISSATDNISSAEDNGLSKFDLNFGLKATVLSGNHKGAEVSFAASRKDPITAGSSFDSDIVLFSDNNVAASQITIIAGSIFDDKITLTSNSGKINFNNFPPINLGQTAKIPLPTEVTFGDTTILFERGSGMDKARTMMKPIFLLILSLFVGIIGSIIISNLGSSIKENTFKNKAQSAQVINIAPQVDLTKQKQTASLLKEQIIKMGLESYITTLENADGSVVTSGNIATDQMPVWRSVLQWYDGQPNMAYLVNNVTSKKVATFNLAIKSVWLDGDYRVIVLSDGQTAKVGETVKGGWIIKEILNDHIIFNRSSQTVKINY